MHTFKNPAAARVYMTITAMLFGALTAAAEPPVYQNPLIPGNLADPAVIHHEGTYYLYATGEVENRRGTRVFTSPNLVDWTRGPVVFEPGLPEVWAPDVWRDPASGKFYLYYTAGMTVGVAEADSPLGPFKRLRKFFDQALDAHLFRDDDGKLYLYYVTFPDFRIMVQPMASPTEPAGEPVEILRPESPWETRNGHVTEGPWIIKRDKRYHLLYSGSGADTPDYAVGYATADSPLGPFTRAPHNPILSRADGLFGPGHGCAIQDAEGKWWFIYHQKENDGRNYQRFIAMDRLWFDRHGALHGRATRGTPNPAPATAPIAATPPPARPNVVFILADDLGWSDTTLYGTTKFYQTPNIERLARRGMTFTRAYSASPLCSPTRAAILTGLSPARTGITTPNCHLPQVVLEAAPGKTAPPDQKSVPPKSVSRLKTDYRTLPVALKEAGYATGHFGKWHLGPPPYSPLEHGFDVDIPHHPGPGPAGSFVAPWKFRHIKANFPGEHIEDRMAKEAVAWMENHKDRPFFLNYWQFSVHAPFDAKPDLIEKHRARVNPADPQRSPTYAAMVESLDDAVGTLLDALERLGLTDNTIIVFASDNGGNMYDTVDGTTPTSNAPLRGGKATLFDGGTRVPCVIAWPGITPPGSRSDAMIQSEDYYPTLLAGLGIDPAGSQHFDGRNILPALRGGTLPERPLFQYFPHAPRVPDWLPPAIAVHRGDWKLIRIFHGGEDGGHRHLLFNLGEDPGEKSNLAAQRPQLVRDLDALIDTFLAETNAAMPVPNPAFDPARHDPADEGQQKPRRKPKAATTGKP